MIDRALLLARIQAQEECIGWCREMLDGCARDYAHLMRRIALRFTIERAETNIKRLREKL